MLALGYAQGKESQPRVAHTPRTASQLQMPGEMELKIRVKGMIIGPKINGARWSCKALTNVKTTRNPN